MERISHQLPIRFIRRLREQIGQRFAVSGQTLVEFALILPVLLAFIFGIIEMGRLFESYVTLQRAASEATRYATTGDRYDPATLNDPGIDARERQIIQIAKDSMLGFTIVDTANSNQPEYFNVVIQSERSDPNDPDETNAGGPNDWVRVELTYNEPLFFWLMRDATNSNYIQLKASARVVNEPFTRSGPAGTTTPEPTMPPAATSTPTVTPTPTATATPTATPTPACQKVTISNEDWGRRNGNKDIRITWDTNMSAGTTSSEVTYSFNNGPDQPATGDPSNHEHRVTLSGAPKGKYTFTATSRNSCGQSDSFQGSLCDDDVPDFDVNDVSVSRSTDPDHNDLIITWSTNNIASSSEVTYRINGGGWQSAPAGNFGTSHTVTIPNAPKGQYEFQVKSATLCDESHSENGIDYCDTLVNENIVINHPVGSNTFTISWHTNMDTEETRYDSDDCRVDLTYPDGDTEHRHFRQGGQEHSVSFSGASARGKYHYRITATNECGVTTITEADYCDGTLSITGNVTLRRDPGNNNDVLIEWTTDQVSSSAATYYYNDSATPQTVPPGDTNGNTQNHQARIRGAAKGKYAASVVSTNACGTATKTSATPLCDELTFLSGPTPSRESGDLVVRWKPDQVVSSTVTFTPSGQSPVPATSITTGTDGVITAKYQGAPLGAYPTIRVTSTTTNSCAKTLSRDTKFCDTLRFESDAVCSREGSDLVVRWATNLDSTPSVTFTRGSTNVQGTIDPRSTPRQPVVKYANAPDGSYTFIATSTNACGDSISDNNGTWCDPLRMTSGVSYKWNKHTILWWTWWDCDVAWNFSVPASGTFKWGDRADRLDHTVSFNNDSSPDFTIDPDWTDGRATIYYQITANSPSACSTGYTQTASIPNN